MTNTAPPPEHSTLSPDQTTVAIIAVPWRDALPEMEAPPIVPSDADGPDRDGGAPENAAEASPGPVNQVDNPESPDATNSAEDDTDDGVDPITDAIEGAEVVVDPLFDLVERTKHDPGAPLEPDMIDLILELKRNSSAEFERLRVKLKDAGVRLKAFDEAVQGATPASERRDPSHADILVDLASHLPLFHTADGTGYADIEIDGHRETWSLRSRGFSDWLTREFLNATRGAPSSEARQSAINTIQARARFDAPELPICVRVGAFADKFYLDLGDATWRAVEIGTTGWRVITDPPVRFVRASGVKPLPIPVTGGSISSLRSLLNVPTDNDFILIISWVLACLRPKGPYPILAVAGEQGSAKSTFSAMLRSLVDPNSAPLRALPKDDHSLFIAAKNGHLLAYDNVSEIPAATSDTLCRLATGGGFASRQLYTDQDEVLFDAMRPIILNGIDDVVKRHDLADRSIFIKLKPISDERRRPEADLWTEYDTERPRILGVLLDALVEGLRRLPSVELAKLPRMADFAIFATACETAFWPSGTFSPAYAANRNELVDDSIDADPVAAAVRGLMAKCLIWQGTPTALLQALTSAPGKANLPNNANVMSRALTRSQKFLRNVGIQIVTHRENGPERTRLITITRDPAPTATGEQEDELCPSSQVLVPAVVASNETGVPVIIRSKDAAVDAPPAAARETKPFDSMPGQSGNASFRSSEPFVAVAETWAPAAATDPDARTMSGTEDDNPIGSGSTVPGKPAATNASTATDDKDGISPVGPAAPAKGWSMDP